MTVHRYPFKHVYTGIDKTVKRALPLKIIRRIKELDLSLKSSLDFARDMFLFSFYTWNVVHRHGISQEEGFAERHPFLSQTKDGAAIIHQVGKIHAGDYRQIPANENGYLLPIIKTDRNERLQYRNALRLVNNKLKEISRSIGLQAKLTMYVSRHSWASIAKSQNIPLSVISAGMGHDSENTTQIYLASLDNSTIDKANDLILKKLR